MNEDTLIQLHKSLAVANTLHGFLRNLFAFVGKTAPTTKVFIYKEGDHRIPNIHVYYGTVEKICLSINSGNTLAGEMNPERVSKAKMWILEHKAELLDRWSQVQKGIKPKLVWASDE